VVTERYDPAVVVQVSGPAPAETLRPDQRARRDRIVKAGLRALASGEYDRIKITEVARDSGVALGTLYRYFASKEHLFAAVFYQWQESMRRNLAKVEVQGDNEADRLRDIMSRSIRAFQLQPQFFRVMLVLQTTADPYAAAIFSSLNGLFRDAIQVAFDGPFDADREAIFRTLQCVLDEELRSWVMGRQGIEDVYASVDKAIHLIYEYSPTFKKAPARRRKTD
jgi:AcrR family transcriptional regulator